MHKFFSDLTVELFGGLIALAVIGFILWIIGIHGFWAGYILGASVTMSSRFARLIIKGE